MVEYRRRPPPSEPSEPSRRREEPEEEKGVTRGGQVPPWRRTFRPEPREEREAPYGQPPQLWEILVPEWERGKEWFEPGAPFQYQPPGPELPLFPGAGPERREPSGVRPPARPKGASPLVNPADWFDVGRIWGTIRQQRTHPQFPKGVPVSIIKVTPPRADEAGRAADLVRFFRIPREEVERNPGRAFWDVLIHPFLDELSYAFNHGKPSDIPGDVAFQAAPDGSLRLSYTER